MQSLADLLMTEQEHNAWRLYMAEVVHGLLPPRLRGAYPSWREIANPAQGHVEVTRSGDEILDSILTQALGG